MQTSLPWKRGPEDAEFVLWRLQCCMQQGVCGRPAWQWYQSFNNKEKLQLPDIAVEVSLLVNTLYWYNALIL
jgi:hypothetical protein